MPACRHRLAWIGALLLGGCGLAAAEHRVQTKTQVDRAEFSVRAQVLGDGALLACYVRAGAASRPTLVLVPETHGDRSQYFEPQFLAHLPADLPLVVIESRGQGRSWPPPEPGRASIESYADDVLAIVAGLKLERWVIGGHSLGGMIALEVAGRRPAGLRGVVALEGWVHSRVQRLAFPPVVRTEAQSAEARRQREERYRSQRWTPEEFAALGRLWTAWDKGEAIVQAIALPVLTIWGDRGLEVRPGREKLLLPDRPNFEVVWIPGADHYVTDSPYAADTARAITRFLDRPSSP